MQLSPTRDILSINIVKMEILVAEVIGLMIAKVIRLTKKN